MQIPDANFASAPLAVRDALDARPAANIDASLRGLNLNELVCAREIELHRSPAPRDDVLAIIEKIRAEKEHKVGLGGHDGCNALQQR